MEISKLKEAFSKTPGKTQVPFGKFGQSKGDLRSGNAHQNNSVSAQQDDNQRMAARKNQLQNSEPESTPPVTFKELALWLRRARRKYYEGVPVIKVNAGGKLSKRRLFIGSEPEYLEITTDHLFEVACHFTDIMQISHGTDHEYFHALEQNQQ